jgi:FixJ family two-component response regulator
MVHVVEDDDSVRIALVRLLRSTGYETRAYASAGEFVMSGPPSGPGCAVLDLNLPGISGLDLHDALSRRPTPLPVVFVTGYGDVPSSVRAMKTGAVDFLTKPVNADALLKAVECALERDGHRRADESKLAEVRERYRRLTPREREVFAHVIRGRLNKQIAADLGTCERTVKAHRSQLMQKMGVRCLAELVRVGDQLSTFGADA